MNDAHVRPLSSSLCCPRCGSNAVAPDPAPGQDGEFVCGQCGTRSRLLSSRHVLLQLGWECPECRHDNERGNEFCTQCGTPLMKRCPNCGATMRVGDQFCNQCGKSRVQIIAELYRLGRGALDAGRPHDAVAPLRRLHDLDPEYGDIPNLLARANRESMAQPQPPAPLAAIAAPLSTPPVASSLPVVRAVQNALSDAKLHRKAGVRRLWLLTGATVAGLGLIATVAGVLLDSAIFGVLFFVLLCAIVAVNLWAAINNL